MFVKGVRDNGVKLVKIGVEGGGGRGEQGRGFDVRGKGGNVNFAEAAYLLCGSGSFGVRRDVHFEEDSKVVREGRISMVNAGNKVA